MKEYTFKLIISEGCDEYWESNPSPEDVCDLVNEVLYNSGFDILDLRLVQYKEDTAWN